MTEWFPLTDDTKIADDKLVLIYHPKWDNRHPEHDPTFPGLGISTSTPQYVSNYAFDNGYTMYSYVTLPALPDKT